MGDLEEVGEMTVMDLLASIIEEAGHVAPPPNSFTVDDYVNQATAMGGEVNADAALTTLRRKVKQGVLDTGQFNVGGRKRWVFWPKT